MGQKDDRIDYFSSNCLLCQVQYFRWQATFKLYAPKLP